MVKRIWNRFSRDQIREIILKIVKREKHGLLITEIAKEMGICRQVVAREVQQLVWTQKVHVKHIQKASLVFYKTRKHRKC
jgi:predicted transcriptional regulator